MEYRRLGRDGPQVSRICLGTMTWGEQNDERDAFSQLDLALEHGVNFIDTAELYPVPPRAETQGRTEQILGKWLSRGRRDRVIVASKVAGPGEYPWIRGGPRLRPDHVRRALDDSLRRLRTDCIDLYQVHWPERRTNFFGRFGFDALDDGDAVPIEDTLEALAREVEAGRVRWIGVSNETPWGLAQYLRLSGQRGWPRVVSIQNPYSLLNRLFEVGLAEFAHREQVPLLAYSPLAMGVLSGKYLGGARPAGARLTLFDRFTRYSGPQAERATAEYVALARAHGLDPAQMALAFVLSRPWVGAAIIGATRLDQLRADLGAVDLVLPPEVLDGIDRIHRACPYPCP